MDDHDINNNKMVRLYLVSGLSDEVTKEENTSTTPNTISALYLSTTLDNSNCYNNNV